MSKKPTAFAGQRELFARSLQQLDAALRRRITELLRRSRKSREQIADEISDLTGLRITDRVLYAWTALSKEQHRVPAAVIPALCQVLDDDSLLRLLACPRNLRVIDKKQTQLLRIAELLESSERAKFRAQSTMATLCEGVA